MVSFPPCKINLGLKVLRKRPDGYHDIETCFYPVPWTDILEVIIADKFEFTSTGLTIAGKEEDNLCVKAYRLLQNDFQLKPVKIHLHKIVPMGAGLGGGSSDAAFTLTTLNELYQLNLSLQQLTQYAAQLGSDCAFFLQPRPMIGTGRGEVLSSLEVDLKNYHLVIVKPPIHVSTAEAYRGVMLDEHGASIATILQQPLQKWKETLINHFEKSVFENHPEIKAIKEKLYAQGAVYASMSGSGSSVFGIFEKPVDLQKEFATYDYWTGGL